MAASRKPPEPSGKPPTGLELEAALAEYHRTYAVLQDARKAHDDARVRVVDMLHRCGLTGIVL